MNKMTVLGLAFYGALGLAACSTHGIVRRTELRPRPRLFVGSYGTGGVWRPEWVHSKEIRQSCPEAVLMLNHDDADYQLTVFWSEDHWAAQLLRSDDAYLLDEDSPDFNRIIRDSCKVLRYDSLEWLAPLKSSNRAAGPTDRFDLRELHNGPLSTSAIIDKKTGKVWIWTNLMDGNGKKTGKSAFLSEDVIPQPEK